LMSYLTCSSAHVAHGRQGDEVEAEKVRLFTRVGQRHRANVFHEHKPIANGMQIAIRDGI
jgi:hypothetical protein